MKPELSSGRKLLDLKRNMECLLLIPPLILSKLVLCFFLVGREWMEKKGGRRKKGRIRKEENEEGGERGFRRRGKGRGGN